MHRKTKSVKTENEEKNIPVILVMPPKTAAAPTIAYKPGVMQSSPAVEHSPLKIQLWGLYLSKRAANDGQFLMENVNQIIVGNGNAQS